MHVRLQAGIALGIPVDHWGVLAIRGANNTRRVAYGQNKEVDPVAYQFVEKLSSYPFLLSPRHVLQF